LSEKGVKRYSDYSYQTAHESVILFMHHHHLLMFGYNEERQLMSLSFSLSLSLVRALRLGAVMCLGVTAGAYILTLFAVSSHPWHDIHFLLVSDF